MINYKGCLVEWLLELCAAEMDMDLQQLSECFATALMYAEG